MVHAPHTAIGSLILILGFSSAHAKPLMTVMDSPDSTDMPVLIHYQLNPAVESQLKWRSTQTIQMDQVVSKDSLRKIDLTMNQIPVLDQGRHGSCVTFAITAAIDAKLGQGDHISQLCSLALGKHFEEKGYRPSGWHGAIGVTVLQQLTDFGYIPKSQERGCGGLNHYPKTDRHQTGKAMPLNEFYIKSKRIDPAVEWSSIIATTDVYGHEYSLEKSVNEVKQVIQQGHRVTFGTLLDSHRGRGGALGYFNSTHQPDAWMMTTSIRDDLNHNRIHSGHHMIIYGYDDDALVHDAQGHSQQGVFMIRNSWGTESGYHGNYVMTYEHFALMMHEANKII